eukprot:GEMP01055374.1.p1 GENE.GEMP01055374.1~~GEMP01055374.1.p1  ORF type:complete len:344 (+),score=61.07 GEMP01055374.1:268-1299(+)
MRERHPEMLRSFHFAGGGHWLTTLASGWSQECLAGYLIAAIASTRSPNIQLSEFYDFAAAIIDFCDWDADLFFGVYNITPLQILYVLWLTAPQHSIMLKLSGKSKNVYRNTQGRRFNMDVGFGLGADSRYFLGVGLQVVAIEANPVALRRARPMFTTELASGDLFLIDAAISSSPGMVTLHGADRVEMSRTFIVGRPADPMQIFTIPTTTCSALFDVFGTPIYLKVDIESDSYVCLESLFRSNVTPPEYLSIELEAGHCLEQFVIVLSQMGYSRYKICRQSLYAPARCEQNFTVGCGSGPFGEDAVDYLSGPRWRSTDSVLSHKGWQREFEGDEKILLARPSG